MKCGFESLPGNDHCWNDDGICIVCHTFRIATGASRPPVGADAGPEPTYQAINGIDCQ